VLEVLEGVEHLAEVDAKTATEMLVSLSGVVENVADFTDGDETHNVHAWVANALRVASPVMLVRKYRYHLSRGEWSAAEDTIRSALKDLDPKCANWFKKWRNASVMERRCRRRYLQPFV
jgi:hypothetical protein